MRSGASGSFLARSGTWVSGDGACGGNSTSRTATGALEVDTAGGLGLEREMKPRRPSPRACTSTERGRKSRNRDVLMRIHEIRVLVPQTAASCVRERPDASGLVPRFRNTVRVFGTISSVKTTPSPAPNWRGSCGAQHLVPRFRHSTRVFGTISPVKTPCSPVPNWGLRTAMSPAILAGVLRTTHWLYAIPAKLAGVISPTQ